MIGAGPADDHVHSTAGSADARATVETLCRQAIARGLCRICLTEHLDFDDTLPEYGYYRYQTALEAVEQARERFADQLEIAMGLEVDFEPRFLPRIDDALSAFRVDFLLGSVHVCRGMHLLEYVRCHGYALPVEELAALYREYFSDTRLLLRSGTVDCLAHLDYPAKVGLRSADGSTVPGYDDEMEETLALAVSCGIGLEINTKRAHDGVPLAAPECAVRRYIELGGRTVTLGSDAHSCERLADGLEIGCAVLRRVGLDYQTTFRGRRAERIPLGW